MFTLHHDHETGQVKMVVECLHFFSNDCYQLLESAAPHGGFLSDGRTDGRTDKRTTGLRELDIHYRVAEKYQKVPKSTQKYQKVPKNNQKYQKVFKNSRSGETYPYVYTNTNLANKNLNNVL